MCRKKPFLYIYDHSKSSCNRRWYMTQAASIHCFVPLTESDSFPVFHLQNDTIYPTALWYTDLLSEQMVVIIVQEYPRLSLTGYLLGDGTLLLRSSETNLLSFTRNCRQHFDVVKAIRQKCQSSDPVHEQFTRNKHYVRSLACRSKIIRKYQLLYWTFYSFYLFISFVVTPPAFYIWFLFLIISKQLHYTYCF